MIIFVENLLHFNIIKLSYFYIPCYVSYLLVDNGTSLQKTNKPPKNKATLSPVPMSKSLKEKQNHREGQEKKGNELGNTNPLPCN